MRNYLVFFRAGPQSLYPRLLAAEPERNWDCCVSWYSQPGPQSGEEYTFNDGENKLESFYKFYAERRTRLSYKYYLIVDDDIDFAPGDISIFFTLCNQYGTYLCQPALRWGTNCNHDVTLWNPICVLRNVSFVEVMAPCFSAQALDDLIDTFILNRSTWGIDYAWASRSQGNRRLAILDAIRVSHTKPVDLYHGPFYKKMRSLGIDPEMEYGQLKACFPRFGPLHTHAEGHIFRHPWPTPIGNLLTRIAEKLKKRIHRWRAPARK